MEYKNVRKMRKNLMRWYIKTIKTMLNTLYKAPTEEDVIEVVSDIIDTSKQYIQDVKDL